ncbi:MAG: acetyl-CoA decarbonylase/synthase complex subunit gamma [Anaerolineae bacterium]|nr:acetyl-CoA decarbonylase/synthase complex subunit gamma [Anaerolineae bacterium]MCX8067852.1 acetyl-CoA decarbonylase/synthase complex subunit gamma [Anaerolineae bacterium]MDW7990636.1 acetyl-CoA decarbonylase/synthase complex subunit gamma [Anaerolineae bacterium]
MALTGLQIYKLLPQTNCKECGFPTCLAFAMKLAAKQAELSACPYVSEEAKAQLDAASAPPIRLVSVQGPGHKVEVGNETVIFRHEKTFYHPPGLFLRVKDSWPLEQVRGAAKEAMDYAVTYVGMNLHLDGVAVEADSGSPETFAAAVRAVREVTDRPLILMASDPAVLKAGLSAADGVRPLLYAATAENWQAMAEVAKAANAPLVVRADSLDALADLTEKVKGAGIQDIVLDPGVRDPAGTLTTLTHLRRLALKKNFRPLGYPIITFPGEGASDTIEEAQLAAEHIAKYAGFIVLDRFAPEMAYALLAWRVNIYTNPQEPIKVQPGIYEINNPGPDSPVMITTNFSITYFSVANEVDGSGMPGWLLVADAEGMSVLTAWAAGKFDAEKIAKTVKSTGIEEKINHRKLIIPGAVAVLMGEVEEELPGWQILVGPREAVDLPGYLKLWKSF